MSLKDRPSEETVSPRERERTGVVGAVRTHVETWSQRYIEMRAEAVRNVDG